MVRSLYQKNSMKSSKHSKMHKSMLKTKHRGRSEVKGEKKPEEYKDGIEKKSMSMKTSVKIGGMKGSVKFRQVDDDEINKLKQNQEKDQDGGDSFDA